MRLAVLSMIEILPEDGRLLDLLHFNCDCTFVKAFSSTIFPGILVIVFRTFIQLKGFFFRIGMLSVKLHLPSSNLQKFSTVIH
jgi:hypothetical protein